MSLDQDHANNSCKMTFKSSSDALGGIRTLPLGSSSTIALSATGGAGSFGLIATPAEWGDARSLSGAKAHQYPAQIVNQRNVDIRSATSLPD